MTRNLFFICKVLKFLRNKNKENLQQLSGRKGSYPSNTGSQKTPSDNIFHNNILVFKDIFWFESIW